MYKPLTVVLRGLACVSAIVAFENRLEAEGTSTGRGGDWLRRAVPSLPNEATIATEIELDSKYLFAEGAGPEKVELGILRTNRYHFAEVHFINMLDTPVAIEELKSSCGCMVAAKKSAPVEPGGMGSFIVIVKPQVKEMKYGKSLTVQFDAGMKWQFLITGEFKTDFALQTRRIELSSSSSTVQLKLEPQFPELMMREIFAGSVTGHLKVEDCSRTTDGWVLQCRVPIATQQTSRQLVEILSVVDKETKEKICEVELVLESRDKITCRPETIRMAQLGGEYVGNVLLFGKEVNSYDWTKVYGEFAVDNVPVERAAKVQLDFQSPGFARIRIHASSSFAKTMASSAGTLSGRILVGDGLQVCRLTKIVITGELK